MTSEVGAKFRELKQCQGAKWRTGNEVNSKSYDDDMRKVMKMEILIVGVAGWLAEDPTVVVKPSPNRWRVTTKPAVSNSTSTTTTELNTSNRQCTQKVVDQKQVI